jgi:hypothetical protein
VSDQRLFDWVANAPVDVVIVKGGPGANIYQYTRPATRDGSLHAPVNHSSNKTYGLSNVVICRDPDGDPDPDPPPPAAVRCTGHAFDVRIDIGGMVVQSLGPVVATDPDVFPDREELSQVAFGVPDGPGAVVTADTVFADNSGNPETGCVTIVSMEKLQIDLNNLPGGGVPVLLTAAGVQTIAVAQDGFLATTEVRITGLTVNGQLLDDVFIPVNQSIQPNVVALDLSFLGLPGLTGRVVVHEKTPIPNGMSANAIRLEVSVLNPLTLVTQVVDVKIAHAEADVH